jgi:8-oxo-dGTP pyrophosphatase MutT (NUDIX family)
MAITESQMQTLVERSARVFEEMYHNRPRGGVILVNERGEVLVLKDATNGKWSFPKGAIELCDCGDIMKTAERETREECGLLRGRDYTLYDTRFMNHYNATYFIAEAKPGAAERVALDTAEATGAAWILPERCSIPFADLNAGVRFFLKKWV